MGTSHVGSVEGKVRLGQQPGSGSFLGWLQKDAVYRNAQKAAPPTSRRRDPVPRKAPRYVSILSPLHSLFECPNEEGA